MSIEKSSVILSENNKSIELRTVSDRLCDNFDGMKITLEAIQKNDDPLKMAYISGISKTLKILEEYKIITVR